SLLEITCNALTRKFKKPSRAILQGLCELLSKEAMIKLLTKDEFNVKEELIFEMVVYWVQLHARRSSGQADVDEKGASEEKTDESSGKKAQRSGVNRFLRYLSLSPSSLNEEDDKQKTLLQAIPLTNTDIVSPSSTGPSL
ncbi:hypothetical protein RFI_39555, partial [Reticulomyxa filosa]